VFFLAVWDGHFNVLSLAKNNAVICVPPLTAPHHLGRQQYPGHLEEYLSNFGLRRSSVSATSASVDASDNDGTASPEGEQKERRISMQDVAIAAISENEKAKGHTFREVAQSVLNFGKLAAESKVCISLLSLC
jgi:hypothetical protein